MDLTESPLEGATRHPWERTRCAFFLDRLAPVLVGRRARVLDLGAGDAWFASQLRARFPDARVTCVDLGYDAATRDRLGRLYPGLEFTSAPPAQAFDVVIALDVAEHVEDDRAFVEQIRRERLVPGGHFLFSVPAYGWLFSSHDVALRHHRRYAHRDARRLLEGAGLVVEEGGGLFGSLVAPRALAVALERVRGTRVEDASEGAIAWKQPPWVTRAVMGALGLDARLSARAARRGVDLPGLSYWARARRLENA
jgi:SAM-dependent methyltransferase